MAFSQCFTLCARPSLLMQDPQCACIHVCVQSCVLAMLDVSVESREMLSELGYMLHDCSNQITFLLMTLLTCKMPLFKHVSFLI